MTGNRLKVPVIVHYNARPHKSLVVTQYLMESKFDTCGHPPFSPDVHPDDYINFYHLKAGLSRIRYPEWASVKEAIKKAILEGLQRGLFIGVTMLPERW